MKTKIAPMINDIPIIWYEIEDHEPNNIEYVLIQLGAFLGYVLAWCLVGWLIYKLIR